MLQKGIVIKPTVRAHHSYVHNLCILIKRAFIYTTYLWFGITFLVKKEAKTKKNKKTKRKELIRKPRENRIFLYSQEYTYEHTVCASVFVPISFLF